MKKILFLFVLFILFTGCTFSGQLHYATTTAENNKKATSTGGFFSSIGRYFSNRTLDFVDIFKINVGIGLGLNVNVRATQLVQAGGFYTAATKAGIMGREAGFWNENSLEMGIPLIFYGRDVDIAPAGSGVTGLASYRQQVLWMFDGYEDDKSFDEDYDREFLEIGVSAQAIFPSFEFAIRLKQIADFVIGFTTIDICDDDSK
ncbi:MAG: hypothetical protein ABIH42_05895 [Planctomycetota bacterium]